MTRWWIRQLIRLRWSKDFTIWLLLGTKGLVTPHPIGWFISTSFDNYFSHCQSYMPFFFEKILHAAILQNKQEHLFHMLYLGLLAHLNWSTWMCEGVSPPPTMMEKYIFLHWLMTSPGLPRFFFGNASMNVLVILSNFMLWMIHNFIYKSKGLDLIMIGSSPLAWMTF